MNRRLREVLVPRLDLVMSTRLALHRVAVLAVALHFAALPVAASLHAASHYRYESGTALAHDAEPCPDSARSSHHAHLERDRDISGDLLCAFCQLFQYGLRHQSLSATLHIDVPSQGVAVLSFSEASLPSRVHCVLPRSRAPPRLV